MNTTFMIVYCFHLLAHMGQNDLGQNTGQWFLLCADVMIPFRWIIIHYFNLFILRELILLLAISLDHYSLLNDNFQTFFSRPNWISSRRKLDSYASTDYTGQISARMAE